MTDVNSMPPLAAPASDARPRRRVMPVLGAFMLIVLLSAFILKGKDPNAAQYVGLSMLLFVTGAIGVLVRRNALILFMCIELMLNAVNLSFVTFARMNGLIEGHIIVLFVIIVAAAEVAVGLAIIVSIFRRRHSTNVDDLSLLQG